MVADLDFDPWHGQILDNGRTSSGGTVVLLYRYAWEATYSANATVIQYEQYATPLWKALHLTYNCASDSTNEEQAMWQKNAGTWPRKLSSWNSLRHVAT